MHVPPQYGDAQRDIAFRRAPFWRWKIPLAFPKANAEPAATYKKIHCSKEMQVQNLFFGSVALDHQDEREGACTSEAILWHRSLHAPARI